MSTRVEYNSKLAIGDKITFYLDGEELVGKVAGCDRTYWVNFWNGEQDHKEAVVKIFSHFGISDKFDFRNKVIGRNLERDSSIWPYTRSLEELKKMLDEL